MHKPLLSAQLSRLFLASRESHVCAASCSRNPRAVMISVQRTSALRWRCCLQMLQERRRLHREHEALFDAEVRKLVELQHISRVPAVERLR